MKDDTTGNIKPYDTNAGSKKEQVTQMFDNIAGGYDFLNRLLSARFDVKWRNKLTDQILSKSPSTILDVATGTADVALTLAQKDKSVQIKGVDISQKMLEVGQKKINTQHLGDQIQLGLGDAEKMDLSNDSFDAVTASFGVRNFENLNQGLSEMYRVLSPGGYIYVLEFSKPRIFPFKQLYNLYFRHILPLIGRIRSGDSKAYHYLYESVQAFPDRENFLHKLQEVGFNSVQCTELTLGICQIYSGKK